jgi:hypothetical protein
MGWVGGGGGGAPAYPIDKINRLADQYVKDTEADIKPYLKDISDFGEKLTAKVDDLVAKGALKIDREETELLGRLNDFNERMADFQKTENASVLRDLGGITDDFRAAMSLLDAEDRAEFQGQLKSFEADAARLTAEFDKRASDTIAAGDVEQKQFLDDYETKGISLGDRYLEATGAAKTEFDSEWLKSLDLTPERLSTFTQAADFLSRAAVDTRAAMIDAADPRARELSAIADENAAAMMSGRISADMQANLARSSAMRALQGGFGASSEMGRGLSARDLGLTAMDLRAQGTQDYERQRALNFNTRVVGLQADAGSLLTNDMSARQRQALTNYEVGLKTAESDRDQRQNVFATTLAGNIARVDSRVGRDLGVAGAVFDAGLDTNRLGFASKQNNLAQRTRRQADTATNIWDRDFQARLGIYNTNIGTGRSLYATNVNSAGNIYSTNTGYIGNMTGAQINNAGNVYGGDTRARENAFNTLNRARGSATGTKIDATQKAWEVDQANWASGKDSSNAMWGSLVNMGAQIAGTAVGTAMGNPMAGYQIGSALGSAGSAAITGNTAGGGGGSGGSGGGMFGNLFGSGSNSSGLFSAFLGGRSTAGTTYNSLAAAQNAAPYASIFSNNSGLGYVPVAARA